MSRFTFLAALLLAVASVNAFSTPATTTSRAFVSRPRVVRFMGDDTPESERGVSVDQDGKSNVWAIEPKMEIDTKSSEEKTTSTLIAAGGFAVFAVVAGFLLTHLPDPNQF